MERWTDTASFSQPAVMPVRIGTPPGVVAPGPPQYRDLLARIRGEYIEMPGLALSLEQARRMWGLPRPDCERLLADLVEMGFLTCTRFGLFVRADSGRASA